MTNGQNYEHKEFQKIFSFCRKNPSQSFKILSSLRKTLRLKAVLAQKQSSVSLQAKAQAVVSAILYAGLLVAQAFLNPDFGNFIGSTGGRAMLAFSAILAASGIALVFRLSLPGEMSI